MNLLSLIIPIYKVEEYIAKCFDSIFSQGLDNSVFEVIAIVDGSPDSSIEIVRSYKKQHSNIVLINKENGGVSSARNVGIDIASGKYLMFVDPDDSLFPKSLPQVLKVITDTEADIAVFRSFIGHSRKECWPWLGQLAENESFSGYEVYEKWGIRGCVTGAAFNRTYWERYRFRFPQNVKNSEDSIMFLQCQINANKIEFYNIDLYSVFVRPDSASRAITPQKIEQWFEALKYVKSLKFKYTSDEEIAMIDGINYSIISSITNNAIRLWGRSARRNLFELGIKEYLPISYVNIAHSTLLNKFMKCTVNKSFRMFFFLRYLSCWFSTIKV